MNKRSVFDPFLGGSFSLNILISKPKTKNTEVN